ncbi:MAG: hypothetical protein M3033_04085 [Acidobacteriota bacterium]|nr:hypothetical protein [Acidobacteriota bacterium]
MKSLKLLLLVCSMSLVTFISGAQAAQNKNPTLVAQKLYQAWHLKNRKSALKIADKDAVDKLFGVRWRVMKFEGCKRREGEIGFECIYRDAKNDFSLAMIVEGGVSVGGYNVASLSFSTEE